MKKFLMMLSLFVAIPFLLATTATVSAFQVEGMYVNPGGQGDALLGELYRVDFGIDTDYKTFFTITNSSDAFVQIHVRLRAGKHSVEIWDRQFILTPHDKDWFQIEQDEEGIWIFGDKLRREELKIGLLDTIGFTKGSNVDDMAVGYIEVFGIAAARDPNNLLDCGFFECGDVGNDLFGHVYLGDWQTGEYLGYRMLAMADFRTSHFSRDRYHRDLSNSSVIRKTRESEYPQLYCEPNDVQKPDEWGHYSWASAAFKTDPYQNPDVFTSYGPTWNDGDDMNLTGQIPAIEGQVYFTLAECEATLAKANLGPSRNWSLDDVENALAKSRIKTDYFNRSHGTGSTLTLAAVTFPAKYLHFFWEDWKHEIGYYHNEAAETKRESLTTAPGGVPIIVSVWDMYEEPWGHSPDQTDNLPYEVNLIPVGDISQAYFKEANWPLLYVSPTYDVGPFDTDFDMGWFSISFDDEPFVRGKSIFPGNSLVMHYETANYMHARGFEWHWDNWYGLLEE